MSAVEFQIFVDRLAAVSGEAILPFFRTALGADNKHVHGFDPVTEADRAAEAAMRHLIKQTFPAHGIIGEEFGREQDDASYVWVLDPIDGTAAFLCGQPTWGTLIGLMRDGIPIYGTMNQPFVGESFSGDGRQARYQGPKGKRILQTSSVQDLSAALLATTSPRLMPKPSRDVFSSLEERVKLSRYGGDCYNYALLAAGHLDLVVECGLAQHDIAPLLPLLEGAGAVVTSWQGESVVKGGDVVAAATPELHEAALKALQS